MLQRAVLGALLLATAFLGHVSAQAPARPPIGGVTSPPDAMIFYIARGPADACGPGCAEWIAAEGAVQWDTHKRLFAILDRLAGRKLPIFIRAWGEANLNVAASLGRIARDRGLDTGAGATLMSRETCPTEPACFSLKRGGAPIDARLDQTQVRCDLACVLILAGGVHRSLPTSAKVVISGMQIRNRLGLNVSDERRDGLQTRYGEQFIAYLTAMGLDPKLLDPPAQSSGELWRVELTPDDWTRLRIVNMPIR